MHCDQGLLHQVLRDRGIAEPARIEYAEEDRRLTQEPVVLRGVAVEPLHYQEPQSVFRRRHLGSSLLNSAGRDGRLHCGSAPQRARA